jgi:hypothetical protein
MHHIEMLDTTRGILPYLYEMELHPFTECSMEYLFVMLCIVITYVNNLMIILRL